MRVNLINKIFPSNKKVYLTREGLDELRNKLSYLRHERLEICNRLRNMDPKEKAEYILTNDEMKMLEMSELEATKIANILQNAVLVTRNNKPSDARLGSTVMVRLGKSIMSFTLVSPIEADPSANKISGESPLGRMLLGRKPHEKFRLETPKGHKRGYEVLSIA